MLKIRYPVELGQVLQEEQTERGFDFKYTGWI